MSSRPNLPLFGSSSLQDDLFERYQKVWDRLTEAERNFFKTTPATGVGDIHMQIEKFQDKDRRLRNLRRMQPYVEGLDRYHTVISIFVQRKPEILSLIWGPIKFLLHVAKNCFELFDQILDLFSIIGKAIPQFDAMQQSFPDDEQFAIYLSSFYADILDFHLATLKVWRRSGLRILFEAAWPRYDDTFRQILKNIAVHKEVLDRHFHIRATQANLQHQREAHEAHVIDTLAKHLDPANDGTPDLLRRVEQTLKEFPETGRWILAHPDFRNWIDPSKMDLSHRLLWLVGVPGAGKTHLIVTILDYLGRKDIPASGCLLYSFVMYNNHVCNTKRAILRSFIFQLCNWDKSLAAVAIEDYELKSPYGSRIRSHTISDDELLEKLIHLMGGEPCYVLLDGLDECEEKERGILLTALIKLTKDCHSLRLLVASRKETDLQEQLPRVSTEIPVDIHNGGDIKIYTSQRLEVLGKRIYNSVFSGDTTKELMIIAARKIVSESHGLFLFVQLVIDNLECQTTPEEFSEELGNIPSHDHLNQIYGRIWKKIQCRSPNQLDQVVRILSWLVYSKRPLKPVEIEKAVMIRQHDIKLHKERTLPVAEMIRLCGCIVKSEEYVMLVHFSAKEYLLQKELTGKSLSLADACINVTYTCLTYLDFAVFDDHATRDCFELEDDLMESGAYALHDYVSSYWFQHVRQCLSSGSMTIIQQLSHFVDVRWNKSFPLSEEPRIRLPPEIEKVESSLSDQLLWKLKHVAGWEWRSKSKVCGNEEICPLTLHETARRLQSRFDHLVTSKCNSDCSEYTSCKELHQIYGKRLFRCSTLGCSSTFQDQRTRDCHFITHRPFYCDVVHCDYNVLGFGTRDELCQHQADVHKSQIGGGEPLLCDWTFLDYVMKRQLLSSAIRKGELALVKSLLLSHAQGESCFDFQRLLFDAAEGGSIEVFSLILEKYPGGVSMARERRDVLRTAIKYNHVDIVHQLIDLGADIQWKENYNDWRMLHYASMSEYGSNVLRLLLDRGADIEAKCNKGKTPLHYVVGLKHTIKAVNLLIDHGADIEAKDNKRKTPLHYAVGSKGSIEAVNLLIDRGPNIEAKDNGGKTPLHYAVESKYTIEVMNLLIVQGADINAKDNREKTPLHYAIESKCSIKAAKLLIDRRADIEAKDYEGKTPLHYAVESKYTIETMNLLIDQGADIEAKDYGGKTPLHYAVESKYTIEAMNLLINQGADIEAKDNGGKAPLHYAVESKYTIEAINLLINQRANIEAKNNKGKTPLHYAIESKYTIEAINLLIDREADIEAKDNERKTPLHYAVEWKCSIKAVKLLIDRGADIEAKDNEKKTPLHYAVGSLSFSYIITWKCNIEAVNLLIDRGADIEAKDNKGKTPLHISCLNTHDNPDCMKELLRRGAKANERDSIGQTPLHYICERHNGLVNPIKTLLAHGADVMAANMSGTIPISRLQQIPELADLIPPNSGDLCG